MVSKFLQLTNHHARVEVTGKRVNRGVGLGLEIPVNYFFGDTGLITWVKNSLKKLDNELHVKVKKRIKQKHACVFYFPNQSWSVRY